MSGVPHPSEDSPDRPGYVPSLDGWRAIAVLGVIAFHLRSSVHERWPGSILADVVGCGRSGVDLFFAISGFLITSRLVAELDRAGKVRIGAFYARRAFRILPPVLFYLAVIGAFALRRSWRPTSMEWFGSLLFFRNFVSGHRLTEHLWSLSLEEHFYLVWPILFVAVARVRKGAWIVALFAIGVGAWRELVVSGVVHPNIPGDITFRTDLRFDALLWGSALALALRSEGARAIATRLLSWPTWIAAIAAFIYSNWCSFHVAATLLATSAPIVIAATALHPRWIVTRALERPLVRWIGRLSYSLYLFQQAFVAAPLPVPRPLYWLLPVACVSYYLVERPMIRVGRDLLAGRRAHVALAATCAAIAIAFVVYVGWPRDLVVRGARVVVYEHDQLCGPRATFGPGRYDLTTAAMGNDVISSLQVGTGVRVRLCDDVVLGEPAGECVDYPPGSVVMGLGELNDRVSFVEVVATGE